MAPDVISVTDFDDYVSKLEKAKVIVDPERRRTLIADGIAALAEAEGLSISDDPGS